jgi:hypothetical protein
MLRGIEKVVCIFLTGFVNHKKWSAYKVGHTQKHMRYFVFVWYKKTYIDFIGTFLVASLCLPKHKKQNGNLADNCCCEPFRSPELTVVVKRSAPLLLPSFL